jgi:deoxyribonucleoside regulator
VLYNFIDVLGNLVDHDVNERVISVNLANLRRANERILISGGIDKKNAVKAAVATLRPTTLITDEQTARYLVANKTHGDAD